MVGVCPPPSSQGLLPRSVDGWLGRDDDWEALAEAVGGGGATCGAPTPAVAGEPSVADDHGLPPLPPPPEPVDLGPIFLREYLRVSPNGDGRLDLDRFMYVVGPTWCTAIALQ